MSDPSDLPGYRRGRAFGFIVGAVLGAVVGFLLSHHPSGPQVVVHMPADAAPLEALAPLPEGTRVVESDAAVLWWTVFKEANDNGYSHRAADFADQAIKAVYGRPKPSP